MSLEHNLERIRGDFPVTKTKIYMDHAALSPLCVPVVEAMRRFLEESASRPIGDTLEQDAVWEAERRQARVEAAKLMNAGEDEVALMRNTTQGVNLVLRLLDWRRGDNVVLSDLEYPANLIPWFRLASRGVDARVVRNMGGRISLSDVEAAVDDRTRVIAISWVQWTNGFRSDLKSLAKVAREKGALLFVDAAQALGALVLDVKASGVDFVASCGNKWLCGPMGTGLFFCRRALVERFEPVDYGVDNLEPLESGPKAYESPEFSSVEFSKRKLKSDARRFEAPGTPNMVGDIGFGAALKYLNALGARNIEARLFRLTSYLIERLQSSGLEVVSPTEETARSGIVSFKGGSDLSRFLLERNIIVSTRFSAGKGGVRISPHFYNSEEEIDVVADRVRQFMKRTA